MKHFTCDIIVAAGDDRYLEWALFICAESFETAAAFAEKQVATLSATARIEEISLQIIPTKMAEEEALRSGNRGAVYFKAEPREIIRCEPAFGRLFSWLTGRGSSGGARRRLSQECERLNSQEEQRFADEGLENDRRSSPNY
jgi:hypothetical protein